MRSKGHASWIGRTFKALSPPVIFAVWIVSIILVIYASLAPKIEFPFSFWSADKVYHMLAYAWLSFLSFWVFKQRKTAIIVAFSLILLGVALEYCQNYSPGRMFSVWDMSANSLGVLLGIVLGEYS